MLYPWVQDNSEGRLANCRLASALSVSGSAILVINTLKAIQGKTDQNFMCFVTTHIL